MSYHFGDAIITTELTKYIPEKGQNNFPSNKGVLIDVKGDNKTTCCLEKLYFESNKAKQTLVSITSCDIRTFDFNNFHPDNYDVMYVETGSLVVENCEFYLNQVTPMSLKGATTLFHGDNMFYLNKVLKGGGISADQVVTITVFQYGIVTNTAYYTDH